MADVDACGAWADSTTPEWAQGGKVTCARPAAGSRGHQGPHSARASSPAGGRPVTLSWSRDARPDKDKPPVDDEPDLAPLKPGEPDDEDLHPQAGVEALLVELERRGLIPSGMDVAGMLTSLHALEAMLDEGWQFVPPEGYVP